MIRPIWYLYEPVDGAVRGIFLVGNPAILWGGLIAVAACLYAWMRDGSGRMLAVAGLWIASYAVWIVIPKSIGFFYYYYLSSIFLALPLAAPYPTASPTAATRIGTRHSSSSPSACSSISIRSSRRCRWAIRRTSGTGCGSRPGRKGRSARVHRPARNLPSSDAGGHRMRMMLAMGAATMLCGCAAYQRPGPGDPPYPRTESSTRKPPREPRVERWTRAQRDCEVGDRKNQRRCVMPYPED